MAPLPGEEGAAKQHAAAVTRDYISQPRLSELFNTHLAIKWSYWIAYFFFVSFEN